MSKIELALQQIAQCRDYSRRIINSIDSADWFRMPQGDATHIAWQVGHLAIAEYRLALLRTRDLQPGDDDIIPPAYLPLFGKGSTPSPDQNLYPSPQEILEVFDRVHNQVLLEVPQFSDEIWDLPMYGEHPLAKTRGDSLLWCARHEMVHAGQIGLLRRLFGTQPLW